MLEVDFLKSKPFGTQNGNVLWESPSSLGCQSVARQVGKKPSQTIRTHPAEPQEARLLDFIVLPGVSLGEASVFAPLIGVVRRSKPGACPQTYNTDNSNSFINTSRRNEQSAERERDKFQNEEISRDWQYRSQTGLRDTGSTPTVARILRKSFSWHSSSGFQSYEKRKVGRKSLNISRRSRISLERSTSANSSGPIHQKSQLVPIRNHKNHIPESNFQTPSDSGSNLQVSSGTGATNNIFETPIKSSVNSQDGVPTFLSPYLEKLGVLYVTYGMDDHPSLAEDSNEPVKAQEQDETDYDAIFKCAFDFAKTRGYGFVEFVEDNSGNRQSQKWARKKKNRTSLTKKDDRAYPVSGLVSRYNKFGAGREKCFAKPRKQNAGLSNDNLARPEKAKARQPGGDVERVKVQSPGIKTSCPDLMKEEHTSQRNRPRMYSKSKLSIASAGAFKMGPESPEGHQHDRRDDVAQSVSLTDLKESENTCGQKGRTNYKTCENISTRSKSTGIGDVLSTFKISLDLGNKSSIYSFSPTVNKAERNVSDGGNRTGNTVNNLNKRMGNRVGMVHELDTNTSKKCASESDEMLWSVVANNNDKAAALESGIKTVLPNLNRVTSLQYKLCNSLSATIFRETQVMHNSFTGSEHSENLSTANVDLIHFTDVHTQNGEHSFVQPATPKVNSITQSKVNSSQGMPEASFSVNNSNKGNIQHAGDTTRRCSKWRTDNAHSLPPFTIHISSRPQNEHMETNYLAPILTRPLTTPGDSTENTCDRSSQDVATFSSPAPTFDNDESESSSIVSSSHPTENMYLTNLCDGTDYSQVSDCCRDRVCKHYESVESDGSNSLGWDPTSEHEARVLMSNEEALLGDAHGDDGTKAAIVAKQVIERSGKCDSCEEIGLIIGEQPCFNSESAKGETPFCSDAKAVLFNLDEFSQMKPESVQGETISCRSTNDASEVFANDASEGLANEGLAIDASEGLANDSSVVLANDVMEVIVIDASEGLANDASEGLANDASEGLANDASEGLANEVLANEVLANEVLANEASEVLGEIESAYSEVPSLQDTCPALGEFVCSKFAEIETPRSQDTSADLGECSYSKSEDPPPSCQDVNNSAYPHVQTPICKHEPSPSVGSMGVFSFITRGLATTHAGTTLQKADLPQQPNVKIPVHKIPVHEIPGHEIPGHEIPVHEILLHEIPVHVIPGHEIPVHVIPGHVIPGNEIPGYEIPGDDIPGHEIPGHEIPGHEIPGHEIPGHEIPGHEIPGHEIPGHEIPGHEIPVHEIPGHEIPGHEIPGLDYPRDHCCREDSGLSLNSTRSVNGVDRGKHYHLFRSLSWVSSSNINSNSTRNNSTSISNNAISNNINSNNSRSNSNISNNACSSSSNNNSKNIICGSNSSSCSSNIGNSNNNSNSNISSNNSIINNNKKNNINNIETTTALPNRSHHPHGRLHRSTSTLQETKKPVQRYTSQPTRSSPTEKTNKQNVPHTNCLPEIATRYRETYQNDHNIISRANHILNCERFNNRSKNAENSRSILSLPSIMERNSTRQRNNTPELCRFPFSVANAANVQESNPPFDESEGDACFKVLQNHFLRDSDSFTEHSSNRAQEVLKYDVGVFEAPEVSAMSPGYTDKRRNQNEGSDHVGGNVRRSVVSAEPNYTFWEGSQTADENGNVNNNARENSNERGRMSTRPSRKKGDASKTPAEVGSVTSPDQVGVLLDQQHRCSDHTDHSPNLLKTETCTSGIHCKKTPHLLDIFKSADFPENESASPGDAPEVGGLITQDLQSGPCMTHSIISSSQKTDMCLEICLDTVDSPSLCIIAEEGSEYLVDSLNFGKTDSYQRLDTPREQSRLSAPAVLSDKPTNKPKNVSEIPTKHSSRGDTGQWDSISHLFPSIHFNEIVQRRSGSKSYFLPQHRFRSKILLSTDCPEKDKLPVTIKLNRLKVRKPTYHHLRNSFMLKHTSRQDCETFVSTNNNNSNTQSRKTNQHIAAAMRSHQRKNYQLKTMHNKWKVSTQRERTVKLRKRINLTTYTIDAEGHKRLYEIFRRRYNALHNKISRLNKNYCRSPVFCSSCNLVQNIVDKFKNLITRFPEKRLRKLQTILGSETKPRPRKVRLTGRVKQCPYSKTQTRINQDVVGRIRKVCLVNKKTQSVENSLNPGPHRRCSCSSSIGSAQRGSYCSLCEPGALKIVDSLVTARNRIAKTRGVATQNMSKNACYGRSSKVRKTPAASLGRRNLKLSNQRWPQRSRQVDSGHVDSRQVDSGQVDSRQVDYGQVDYGQVDSRQVDYGQVDSGQVDSGQDLNRNVFNQSRCYLGCGVDSERNQWWSRSLAETATQSAREEFRPHNVGTTCFCHGGAKHFSTRAGVEYPMNEAHNNYRSHDGANTRSRAGRTEPCMNKLQKGYCCYDRARTSLLVVGKDCPVSDPRVHYCYREGTFDVYKKLKVLGCVPGSVSDSSTRISRDFSWLCTLQGGPRGKSALRGDTNGPDVEMMNVGGAGNSFSSITCNSVAELCKEASVPADVKHLNAPAALQHFNETAGLQHLNETAGLQHLNETAGLQHLNETTCVKDLNGPTCLLDQKGPTCLQDLNRPTCLQDLNRPTCLQDLNRPTCVQDLNRPTCLHDLNSSTCLQHLHEPTCLQDLNRPTRLQHLHGNTCLQDLNGPTCLQDLNRPTCSQSPNAPGSLQHQEMVPSASTFGNFWETLKHSGNTSSEKDNSQCAPLKNKMSSIGSKQTQRSARRLKLMQNLVTNFFAKPGAGSGVNRTNCGSSNASGNEDACGEGTPISKAACVNKIENSNILKLRPLAMSVSDTQNVDRGSVSWPQIASCVSDSQNLAEIPRNSDYQSSLNGVQSEHLNTTANHSCTVDNLQGMEDNDNNVALQINEPYLKVNCSNISTKWMCFVQKIPSSQISSPDFRNDNNIINKDYGSLSNFSTTVSGTSTSSASCNRSAASESDGTRSTDVSIGEDAVKNDVSMSSESLTRERKDETGEVGGTSYGPGGVSTQNCSYRSPRSVASSPSSSEECVNNNNISKEFGKIGARGVWVFGGRQDAVRASTPVARQGRVVASNCSKEGKRDSRLAAAYRGCQGKRCGGLGQHRDVWSGCGFRRSREAGWSGCRPGIGGPRMRKRPIEGSLRDTSPASKIRRLSSHASVLQVFLLLAGIKAGTSYKEPGTRPPEEGCQEWRRALGSSPHHKAALETRLTKQKNEFLKKERVSKRRVLVQEAK